MVEIFSVIQMISGGIRCSIVDCLNLKGVLELKAFVRGEDCQAHSYNEGLITLGVVSLQGGLLGIFLVQGVFMAI